MEELNIEKKENLSVTTETLNTDALIALIYKGKNIPQDGRFLSTKDGGVFEDFSPGEDLGWNKDKLFFPIVKVGDKVVGISKLQMNPYIKNNLWIQLLSIDPDEQGKGYASKLAKEIFRFAKENGYTLESSSYKEKGFEKLKPLFNRLAKEYSIPFIDKGKL